MTLAALAIAHMQIEGSSSRVLDILNAGLFVYPCCAVIVLLDLLGRKSWEKCNHTADT